MGLDFSSFGPMIGLVVMVYITEEQAVLAPVKDNPDVSAYSDRPEVLVSGFIQFVELMTRICRVHLQVEGGGFHLFLIVSGKAGQASGEGVGDAEYQGFFLSMAF